MMPTNVKANVKHVCLPALALQMFIRRGTFKTWNTIYMKWNEIKWMKYILPNKINNNFR